MSAWQNYIPLDWEIVQFSNIAELRHGYQFRHYDFTEDGVKVFKITQIKGDGLADISSCSYIEANRINQFKKFIIYKGDILIALTGATIGKIAKYSYDEIVLQNYRVGNFFPIDENILLKEYLFQFLKSDYFYNQILAGQTQSAQQNIGKEDINNMSVILPPLPEQIAIASILSAIDDKIELNLQTNKTLEEMAMTLYKHWFVDFGPFREGEFVDSELGMIPKGWEVKPFSEITSRITDGAHQSPKSVDIGMPMASVKDMSSWGFCFDTCRQISIEDYQVLINQGCRPMKNDIVIAKDGSYLKHSFIVEKDLDIVLLSSIAILKPNGILHPQLMNLYLKLDSVKDRMKTIVSGAAIQRIVLTEFRKFLTIVPPVEIQNKALESIEFLVRNCWNNNSENQTLTTLRDTLLPKLISGEVRVKEFAQT